MEVEEQHEARVSEIHDLLARHLRDKLKDGTASPSEMRIALDLVKYNRIDDGGRKGPVTEIESILDLPFSAVDSEIN